jgi:hypothetical protein
MLYTMKLNLLTPDESRWDWMNLGNDASLTLTSEGSIPESKSNRCYVSSHRHGGVRGVGMLRSVIDIIREILIDAEIGKTIKATHIASCHNSKGVMVGKEVGGVYSSVDVPVMGYGAKRPYLVDVNRERKDM